MAFIPPTDALKEEEETLSFKPPEDAIVVQEKAAPVVQEQETFVPPVDSAAEPQEVPAPSPVTEQAPEAPKIRFSDLSARDEYFKVIEDYANSSRFGGKVQRKEGESKEDFVDRFATHMRMLDSGNMISTTQEQEWLNSAPPEDVMKAGRAYNLFKSVPSFYEEGGDSTINAIADYAKATISDPTTLLGLGAGKLAVSGLTKLGRYTGMFMAPVIEGYGAGYANVSEQKRDIAVADVNAKNARAMLPEVAPEDRPVFEKKIQALENRVREGIDKGKAATSAALGATLGLIEPAALLLTSKGLRKTSAEDLDSILKTRRELKSSQTLTGDVKKDAAVEATTSLKTGEQLDLFPDTAAAKQMDDLAIPSEGRKTLDEQGAPTAIAQMEIKSNISKQAVEIATNVWKQMPELGIQKGETVDNAINRTLQNLGGLPDDVFESLLIKDGGDMQKFVQTLADADIDLQSFANANSVSVSEGARRMQALSVVARLENKLKNLDKKVLGQVKAFYNPAAADNPHMNAFNAVKDFVIKADKNMIVAMTMNASTLSRNVFGMGANATMGVGEEAVESIVFSLGKTLAEKVSGRPVTGSIGKASKQATKDALGLLFYINEPALTTDITQSVLKDSPALMNKLLLTAEEMKKSDLYRPVQILNTPAVMVDKFVRQAVFSSSLERNMRRNGLNMYDVMSQNKNIPVEILRKSVDDAVAFTFSKHPTNPILSGFVKLVENTRPISSLAFPFARFMANAAEWTLERYNPINTLTGTSDLIHGVNLARKGEFDAGLGFINKGSEKIGKQTLGMITFLGAYGYRKANQDTPWDQITSDDNTKVSSKYLFPLNIPLALSDFTIKAQEGRTNEFKVRDLVEAVVGYKSTVGTQDWFIDRVIEWAGNGSESDEVLTDKLGQLVGEFFGKFLGRATVPLNQISDVLSAFDRDEAIPRDAYVLREGEERGFTTSFTKMIKKGVPVLKQALPEYQPATRGIAPYRDSGPLKQFTGLALEPYKNKLESEITRLNIRYTDIYKGTGNRTFDAEARATMARLLPFYMTPLFEGDMYKNASREGQRNELMLQLKNVQALAKTQAKNQNIADAYNKGKTPQILIDKYLNIKQDLLPSVKKKYKDMTGTDFDEDTDIRKYQTALAIYESVRKYPAAMSKNFALGGVVGAQLAKQVGKKSVKGLASAGIDLIDEMQTKIAAKKAAPVAEDVTQQTQKAVSVAESVPTPEPAGLAKYAPEEVSAAEQQAMQMEGASTMEWLKKNQPEKYENTVFIHMNKTDPEPHPGAGTVFDYLDDEGVYDFTKTVAQKEVDKPKGLMQPVDEPVIIASDKAVKGLIKNVRNTADRNDMLEQIREVRTQRFPKLKVEGVEDSVIGVAQGDFRMMNGREADPSKAKDRSAFKTLAMKKQKELDRLRAKYKDTPPVEIFHGNANRAEQLSKEGFTKPQRAGFTHSELEVAAPSFTKDLNLQFNTGSFGGTDPSAFVSTKIPYADYLFSRINMPKKAYENKDLDVIAQAISGDPASTRPLSLPREGSMNETEDAFVEADKLLISKAEKSVAGKLPDYKEIAAKRDMHQDSYSSLVKDWNKLNEKEQVMAANKAYKDIREMFKTYASAAKITSTKTGMGQQYTAAVARSPLYEPMLNKIAGVLEKQGSTERAALLRKIGGSIAELRKTEDRVPATRVLQDTASKLAKGGLASRK